MKAYNIGECQEFVHTHFFNPFIAKPAFVFVIGNDSAFKPFQTLCKGTAHIAITDNSNRFPFDFQSTVPFPVPNTLSYLLIGSTKMIKERNQHAERMLTKSIPVSFRGI